MIIPSEKTSTFYKGNTKQGISGQDILKNSANANFWQGTYNSGDMYYDPLITGFGFFVWTRLPVWVTDRFRNFKALTQKELCRV